MIFSEKSIKDILENNKQQTRRLVKEGEASNIVDFERVVKKDNDGICITDEVIKMFKNIVQEIPITVFTNCIRKKEYGVNVLNVSNFRVKWQVGKSYAVQNKRGGRALGLCDCGKVYTVLEKRCHAGWRPLRVKITGIRKERLNSISCKDIIQEGYTSREEFFSSIINLNIKKIPKKVLDESFRKQGLSVIQSINRLLELWNPFVWVLSFEVVE